jgi:FKBP-type peptidyl-prolyl cis-trans isomerase FklB
MKATTTLIAVTATLLAVPAFAAEPAAKAPAAKPAPAKPAAVFKTDKERISYAVGLQFAQNVLKRSDLDLDPKATAMAIQDVLSGTKPKLTTDEIRAAMELLQKQQAEKLAGLATRNLEAGKAFLEENRKKEGVVTRESGLQYKVLTEGSGKQPKATDKVTAHYRGTLINGSEFDSSYRRNEPATFPLNSVIKGWQEALPLMKEGAKWQVVIPPELAYGPRGAGGAIGPNETLIFEIELIKVEEGEAKEAPKG